MERHVAAARAAVAKAEAEAFRGVDEVLPKAAREVARREARVGAGGSRVFARFRAWRRARRTRRDRERFAEEERQLAQHEHASSAVLAALTERIARAGSPQISASELAVTIARVEAIVRGYYARALRLGEVLEVACTQTRHWRQQLTAAGRNRERIALARSEIENCEHAELELAQGTLACQAGCRRMEDALAELRHVAARATPAV